MYSAEMVSVIKKNGMTSQSLLLFIIPFTKLLSYLFS